MKPKLVKKVPDKNVCVYLHRRNGKLFYVGIGSVSRSKNTKSRPAKWYELCPDNKFSVEIYRKGLSRREAEEIEMAMVKKLTNKGADLANSHIEKPGVVAIDLLRGNGGEQNKKTSGRTLNVPWLMLDSFGSAGQPFRFQITVDGKTKRMFSETLPDLLNDVCSHFACAYQAKQFATKVRLQQLQDFLTAFDFFVANGALVFLERYADQKRHAETLAQCLEIPRYKMVNGVLKSEGLTKIKKQFYHSGAPLKEYPPCENWPSGPRARLVKFISQVERVTVV